jgi:hypothetical protein
MNWITELVEANSENEAPQRFFYWSALTVMSGVIRKNIYLDRFFYKLYPNIYTFFIAKSGMKKGIPVSIAKKLIEKSEATRVVAGRSSIQKIIQELGKMKTMENGAVHKMAQATIISGELASFLVKDGDALTILTDLYNTHEHEEKWENSLKQTGIDTLLKPCITLLGATNEDHFIGAVPQADIYGGFIARTFIVYSADGGTPNSLVDRPDKIVNLDDFVPFLKDLAKLKGEFMWTTETAKFYKDWYMDFTANKPEDKTGTYNRIADGIIKVAMLLSLSKRLELTMDLDSLEEAKAECMNCAKDANRISMGGTSTFSSQIRMVMKALLSHPDHKLSRTQILKKLWGDIDAYSIDLIAETLLGAGVIDVYHQGKETLYEMKGAVVSEYLEYEKKVRK